MDAWDILGGYQQRFAHRIHGDRTPLPPEAEPGVEQQLPQEAVPVEELPVLDLTKNKEGLTDDQLRIIRLLDTKQGKLTDEVAEESGLPVRRVLSALTVLEIDGFVTQCSARCFVRTVDIKDERKG